MNLETLLARGEVMLQELGREYYMTGAGLKAEPELQAIYERYRDLAGDDALAAARGAGSPELLEWVVDVRVGRTVSAADERQLVWEQSAVLEVDGHRIPYLRAPIELANSPDRAYRRAVDLARARAGADGLNAIRRERFAIERELVRSLGLGDYVQSVAALSGIELDRLATDCEAFLRRTDAMYRDGLARLVRRRMGVPVGSLVRSDAAWLFRADRFDAAFASDRLVDLAGHQMAEMGLDFTVGGRVRFDTEEREAKQPRAFCIPVRVPDEVYLVLRPRGGHSDYRTFWHELGHAMHFASVDAGLPFAARWLGDNSVTEGFAMLWDHLTLDRGWIERYAGLARADAATLVFELAVGELFLARRYAAKLCYELELYRSDLVAVATRYRDMLTAATGFRYLSEDYLLDVDPGFYAARYLRAWQLEAILARRFTEQYDRDWYRNPAAGEQVRALMARGQADPAHVLARRVAGTALGFAPVVERLERIFE